MPSAKFSSSLTLYRKDMARFWPLWAAYTLLWTILIPVEVLASSKSTAAYYAARDMSGWAGDRALLAVFNGGGMGIALVYGVLCAMAVWSYLYNPRAVNMTHALPLRREAHFAAHFLAGASFFVLPHLVILVLTTLAGTATGSSGDFLTAAAAMGLLTLLCLFFFGLATLCAFVTGHLLALPVFYGIANVFVYCVAFLLDWLSSRFLFGFRSFLAQARGVYWLTPPMALSSYLQFYFAYPPDAASPMELPPMAFSMPTDGNYNMDIWVSSIPKGVQAARVVHGLPVAAAYAGVGLALAGLALLLYRRRKLESAGDVVAVGWMKPVFQCGMALCAALAGSWLMIEGLDWNNKNSDALTAALLTAWGVVGWFAARMLLKKSLKVFRSGWKGGAAIAAALLLLCLGLHLDIFAVERRIPEAGDVDYVSVSRISSYPSDTASYTGVNIHDPALIEKVVAAHRAVAEGKETQKLREKGGEWSCISFEVIYTMKNGSTLARWYSGLCLDPAALEAKDPASPESAITALINDRDWIRMAYRLDSADVNRLTQITLQGLWLRDGAEAQGYSEAVFLTPSSPGYDPDEFAAYAKDASAGYGQPAAVAVETKPAASSDRETRHLVGQDDLRELWQALLADFEAGNVGARSLFRDLSASNPYSEYPSVTVWWQVRRGDYSYEESIRIHLTSRAENTLAVLERLGAFEDGTILLD